MSSSLLQSNKAVPGMGADCPKVAQDGVDGVIIHGWGEASEAPLCLGCSYDSGLAREGSVRGLVESS